MEKDLDHYDYNLPEKLPNVLGIGWLSEKRPFLKGDVSDAFLEKLKYLIERESVNQMRGTHQCPFCDLHDVVLETNSREIVLGSAEVWVPKSGSSVVYGAPNLIYHYILDHKYKPPDCFIEAVEGFDCDSDWSGEESYAEALDVLYP